MPRLPRVTGREVIRALERAGFQVFRITGSHYHLHKWEGDQWSGVVTIPLHGGKIIYPKLLQNILSQAGLTAQEFGRLVK